MVSYTCQRCKKHFYQKSRYNNHIKRAIPCLINKFEIIENNNFYCEICDKSFDRSDVFKKHKLSELHICKTKINTTINTNKSITANNNIKGDVNNMNGNGNVIIKNYNLYPFAKDGIECLTIPEKVAIFTSEKNPYEMIIIKVNLNPINIDHHNVGIPDLHRSYGMIYNGEEWVTEKTIVILDVLLNSKKDDLLKIHKEIKHWLSDDINESINNTMKKMDNTLNAANPIQIKSKNTLTTHLKKYFYNNRDLALEAQKYTQPNKPLQPKNILQNKLKDGLTMEEVEKQYEFKKHHMKVSKEICKDLLFRSLRIKTIDDDNSDLIQSRISNVDNIDDIYILDTILDNLFKSAYLGHHMDDNLIGNKIINTKNMLSFVFV